MGLIDTGFIADRQQNALTEAWKRGQAKNEYGYTQALRSLASKHMNADNTIDQTGFVQDAAKLGLGMDAAKQWLDYQGLSNKTAQDTAQTEYQLRMLGYTPSAMRDQSKIGSHPDVSVQDSKAMDAKEFANGGAAPQAPGPGSRDVQAEQGYTNGPGVSQFQFPGNGADGNTSGTTAGPTSQTGVQDEKQKLSSTAGMTTAAPVNPNAQGGTIDRGTGASAANGNDQAGAPVQQAPQAGATGIMDLGEGRITPSAPEQKPIEEARLQPLPETTRLPPDTRSWLERTQDTWQDPMAQFQMGQGASANGVQSAPVFDYAQLSNSPQGLQLKAGIDATLNKLGLPANQASVDKFIARAEETVAKPVYAPKGIDMKSMMEAQAEFRQKQAQYPAEVAAARNKAIEALASGNTTALAEILGQKGFNKGVVEQRNAAQQANVENVGMNVGAAKITPIGNAAGLSGYVDPRTFKSQNDMEKFNQQTTAYAELQQQIKEGIARRSPLDVLNFAKNYSQAEGLGEAEGTRNLVMMLTAEDLSTRAQLMAALGHGVDGMSVVGAALAKATPANLLQLADGMKFKKDWATHASNVANERPLQEAYGDGGGVVPNTGDKKPEEKKSGPAELRKKWGAKKADRSGGRKL